MEAFGLATGIAQLLDLTGKLCKYLHDVKNSKKEHERWFKKVTNIETVIKSIQLRIKEGEALNWGDDSSNQSQSERLLELQGRLKELLRNMQEFTIAVGPVEGLMKIKRHLTYAFRKERLEHLLRDIYQDADNINHLLSIDHFYISRRNNMLLQSTQTLAVNANSILQVVHDDGKDTVVSVKELSSQLTRMEDLKVRQETEQEFRSILSWLSPLVGNYESKQQQLIEICSKDCAQWFLNSEEFVEWSKGAGFQLKCYGDPGSGKTTLSAIIVNHLRSLTTSSTPVLFIYLDKKDDNLQTAKTILGSMLSQIMQTKLHENLPKLVQEAFRISGKGKLQPRLSDDCRRRVVRNCQEDYCIRDLLYAELKNHNQVYLVVDALDECKERLRHWIYKELITLQNAGVTILTTSRIMDQWKPIGIFCDQCIIQGQQTKSLRLYWHCKDCDKSSDEDFDGFDLCQSCKSNGVTCRNGKNHEFEVKDVEFIIRVPDEPLKQFLISEMELELGEDSIGSIDKRLHSQTPAARFGRMLKDNKDIIEPLSSNIVELSDGKFLFAKLYLSTLETQHNKEGIQNCLNTLPKTLPDIYEKRILRIKNQDQDDSRIALKILSFLTITKQTMTLRQLQHALAIQKGDIKIIDSRFIDAELILDITHGLVVIDSHSDASRSTVRLFHLTLQEYLDSSLNKWFPTAHSDLAFASLNYLQLGVFAEASPHWIDFQKKAETHPFVTYCSHWGDHMRTSFQINKNEELENSALDYLRQPHRINAFSQAAWCAQSAYSDHWDVRRRVSCIHVAAWFGLDGVISRLCQEFNEDVNQREATYFQTPLIYACRRGHAPAVQKLIELEADLNVQSGRGYTALMEAVEAGHSEIVRLLLHTGNGKIAVNLRNEEKSNRTALLLAVQNGHVEIVQQLLACPNIDINLQDSGGFSALIYATRKHAELNMEIMTTESYTEEMAAKLNNYETIIEILSTRTDINLDSYDMLGKSALVFAAEMNDAHVVVMLLDRGASATIKDRQGGAVAIMYAAQRGCKMAFDSMLDNGVDMSSLDDKGRSVIHYAASSGSSDAESIVQLLHQNGLAIDSVDKFNRTPLMEASRAGNIQVVILLLAEGASRSMTDNFGRTAFKTAWEYQRDEVELLQVLEDERSKVDSLSWIRPLWSLAKFGLTDELLERGMKVSDDREPVTQNTALHWAIRENQMEVWNRLLSVLDSDSLDLVDCNGRSGVHFSVLFRREEALKLLISKKANLNVKDQWGCTAIMIANATWRFELAVLLCAAGADLWNALDLKVILFRAVELNNVDAVKKLIDAGVDILSRNENGQTVLDIAKEKGEEADEICHILSQRTFYLKRRNENKTADIVVESIGIKQTLPFRMPLDAKEESARANSSSLLEPTDIQLGERHQTILWPKIPLTPPMTPDLSRNFSNSETEGKTETNLTEQAVIVQVEAVKS